uniref:Uncharacterized protein n=1 Tax=Cacopsylla melanoneura TaxID=428564 RepID=A0A8D8VNP8_9HEMI
MEVVLSISYGQNAVVVFILKAPLNGHKGKAQAPLLHVRLGDVIAERNVQQTQVRTVGQEPEAHLLRYRPHSQQVHLFKATTILYERVQVLVQYTTQSHHEQFA